MMWGTILAGILARPWARWPAGVALAALTVALFILNLRCAGEPAGRLETLGQNHDIQRIMVEAAAGRPRNRDDLLQRLRNGGF